MILYCVLQLCISFLYFFFNAFNLGYFGVYYLTLLNLLISSVVVFWKIYSLWLFEYHEEYCILSWIDFGNNIVINWSFKEDFVTNIIAFIMLFGATIVTTFAFFEMNNDKEGHSFIITLGFFIIFMLIVISASNLIFFYLGWEGISLTSYFLVSFWSERVRSIKATLKIFLISKIGDFFLVIFICYIMSYSGTVDFDELNTLSPLFLNYTINIGFWKVSLNEFLGVMLLLGTMIKSAQFGFHIWLLEAMEAPLGASALMHSSTLVISGVVLLLKLSFIIELSYYANTFMFIIGVLSATFGALFACFQFELKVILAYSTISNMGYIFILFSLGAYIEVFIVLLFHAFIKIFMFLVAGNIIYQNNGVQDIRWMGGLLLYSPFIWSNFLIGSICLIGLPYFSGYYYKYILLNKVLNNYEFLYGGEFFLLISYFLTIFYVLRMGYSVFFSNKNGHKTSYKNKLYSIILLVAMFILSVVIIVSQYFWLNLLETNIKHINYSIFFSSMQNVFFRYVDLTYLTAYAWTLVYVFIFFFVSLYLILNLNINWSFLKNWTFILNIVFVILLYMYIF